MCLHGTLWCRFTKEQAKYKLSKRMIKLQVNKFHCSMSIFKFIGHQFYDYTFVILAVNVKCTFNFESMKMSWNVRFQTCDRYLVSDIFSITETCPSCCWLTHHYPNLEELCENSVRTPHQLVDLWSFPVSMVQCDY